MNTSTCNGQQKILKEVTDEIGECIADEDIALYGKQLGIDIDQEQHLLWIAEEGLQAAVPPPWCPVEDPQGRIYYYNQKTDEASWEHPLDLYYRSIVEQERQKSKSRENTLNISDQGFDSKPSSFADGPLLKSTGKDSVSAASETKSQNKSIQGNVKSLDKNIIQPDTLIKTPSTEGQKHLDSSQLVTRLKQTREEMTGTEKGVTLEGSSGRSLLGRLSGMLKENPRIVKQDSVKCQVKFDLDSDSEDKSHYSYEDTENNVESDNVGDKDQDYSISHFGVQDASLLSPVNSDSSLEVHVAGINEILMLTAHDVQQTTKGNKNQESQNTNLKEVSEKKESPLPAPRKQASIFKPVFEVEAVTINKIEPVPKSGPIKNMKSTEESVVNTFENSQLKNDTTNVKVRVDIKEELKPNLKSSLTSQDKHNSITDFEDKMEQELTKLKEEWEKKLEVEELRLRQEKEKVIEVLETRVLLEKKAIKEKLEAELTRIKHENNKILEQKLQEADIELKADMDKLSKELKIKHQQELDGLKHRSEDEHKKACEEMRFKLEADHLKALTALEAELKQKFETTQKQREEELNRLLEKQEEVTKIEIEKQLEEMRKSLEQKYQSDVAEIERDQQKNTNELKKRNWEITESIRKKHEENLASLKDKNEKEGEELESKYGALFIDLKKQNQNEVEKIRKKHEEDVAILKKQHERKVEELKQKYQENIAEMRQSFSTKQEQSDIMFKGVSGLTKELDVFEKEVEGKKNILEILEKDKLPLDKYRKEKEALLAHLSTLREQIQQEQTALDKLLFDKISLQNEISELKRNIQKVASKVSQKEKLINNVKISSGFSSDTESKIKVPAKKVAKSGPNMDMKTDILLSNELAGTTKPEIAFNIEKLYERLAKFEYKIKRLEKRLVMTKPGLEISSSEVSQPDGTENHCKEPENVEQTHHQKVVITSCPNESTLKKFRRKESSENLISNVSGSNSDEELEDLRLYRVISEGEWKPEDKAQNFITKEESQVELHRRNVTFESPHFLQHYKNYNEREASDMEQLQKSGRNCFKLCLLQE
ncbi:uncharacterized protein LOC143255409 isoform X3 [Tachypleus tridentatus]|uniref:uncharacterized protein LOC143255409 isoform X3 n=1 Tax=Tachypleus tridentatus TaxID=6853 RepID=UPI003FD60795